MYSEQVMDHFSDPRNVGTIEDADGIGEVGNPVCGDMMTFYIRVEDEKIDIRLRRCHSSIQQGERNDQG